MEEIFKGGEESIFVRGDIFPLNKNKIYYIHSGAVALYSNENEQKRFLFVYKSGDIFPYMSKKKDLASGRTLEYKALSTAIVRSLDRKKFDKEVYKPENIRELVEDLMDIMELQIERIDNLEESQTYKRLIERLIYISRRLGIVHGDKIVIDTPMSHVDLASSIGTTRETVNRYMKQLEKKGIIKVERQIIVINSIKMLQEMSNQHFKDKGTKGNFASLAALSFASIETLLAALPEVLIK